MEWMFSAFRLFRERTVSSRSSTGRRRSQFNMVRPREGGALVPRPAHERQCSVASALIRLTFLLENQLAFILVR